MLLFLQFSQHFGEIFDNLEDHTEARVVVESVLPKIKEIETLDKYLLSC